MASSRLRDYLQPPCRHVRLERTIKHRTRADPFKDTANLANLSRHKKVGPRRCLQKKATPKGVAQVREETPAMGPLGSGSSLFDR